MKIFHKFALLILLLSLTTNISYGFNFDGLITYYNFSGNAQDKFGNHGEIFGAELDFDRFDNKNSSYRFDGNDDWIRIDSVKSLLSNDKDISICGWFKTSHNPNYAWGHILFSVNGKNVSNLFRIGTSKNGSFFVSSYEGNDMTFGDGYNDNEWHFFVVMLKKNGELFCYVDNINIITSNYATIEIVDWQSIERVSIGQEWDPAPEVASDFWNGNIDVFMIFNRLLSKEEIEHIYTEKICTVIDTDEDGVPDILDNCKNTPLNSYTDRYGCPITGLYTEEQMNQMVISILSWGDLNGDQKIGLEEVVQALRVTSGVIKPALNK